MGWFGASIGNGGDAGLSHRYCRLSNVSLADSACFVTRSEQHDVAAAHEMVRLQILCHVAHAADLDVQVRRRPRDCAQSGVIGRIGQELFADGGGVPAANLYPRLLARRHSRAQLATPHHHQQECVPLGSPLPLCLVFGVLTPRRCSRDCGRPDQAHDHRAEVGPGTQNARFPLRGSET